MTRSMAVWMSRSRDRVERGGRLVEDEDARVLEQHAGQRDALLLAAGQLVAALADDRVVALGQLADAVVDGRQRAPPPGARVGRVGLRVGRFSRTLAWNRYVSWVTKPMTSPRLASVDLADVDARRSRPRPRRRRTAAAAGRSWWSCPSPTGRRGRPAARARPRSRCPPGRTGRRGASAGCGISGAPQLDRRLDRLVGDHRRRRRRSARRPSPARRARRPALAPSDSGTRRAGSGRCPRTSAGSSVDGIRRVRDLGRQVQVLEDAVEQRQRALHLHLHVEQLAEREEEPRLWSVVKATMSPMVGARRVAVDGQVAGQPVDQRRGDA